MRTTTYTTTLVLISALRASAAHGQGVDAMAHLRRGVELRRDGHDDDARVEFQAAYDAAHSPVAAGQLGFAEQALGQWVAAEAHVREATTAVSDEWVMRNHASLESAYATIQQHIGQLEVTGGPPGAEVRINGEPMGTLPFAEPMHVLAGTVTFEVRQPGYYPVVWRTEILAGALTREDVDLRPLPRESRTDVAASSRRGSDPSSPRARRLDPRWRVVGWSATGVGAALLAAGVIANVLRENRAAFYNTACPGDVSDANITGCTDAHALADIETGLAIAGYATGGALVVAGLVLAISTPPRSVSATGAAACGVGPGTIGVSCAARF